MRCRDLIDEGIGIGVFAWLCVVDFMLLFLWPGRLGEVHLHCTSSSACHLESIGSSQKGL